MALTGLLRFAAVFTLIAVVLGAPPSVAQQEGAPNEMVRAFNEAISEGDLETADQIGLALIENQGALVELYGAEATSDMMVYLALHYGEQLRFEPALEAIERAIRINADLVRERSCASTTGDPEANLEAMRDILAAARSDDGRFNRRALQGLQDRARTRLEQSACETIEAAARFSDTLYRSAQDVQTGAGLYRSALNAAEQGTGCSDCDLPAIRDRAAFLEEQSTSLFAVFRISAQNTASTVLGGIASLWNGGEETAPPAGQELISVYYGTNRNWRAAGRTDPARAYGARTGPLSFGAVEVIIPRTRMNGALRRDRYSTEFGPRDGVHIALTSISRFGRSGFNGALRAALDGTSAAEQPDILVFIQGHDMGFDDAVRRTAQLAADLDMRAGALLFSWPVGSSPLGYLQTVDQMNAASAALAEFLETVLAENTGRRVHIVSYSSGSQLLLDTLGRLQGHRGPLFHQMIWASSDINASAFLRDFPGRAHLARRSTVYASDRDLALAASAVGRGGALRLGQARSLAEVARIADAVDTSAVTREFLGHADFGLGAIDDMRAVLWFGLVPDQRCALLPQGLPGGGAYWRIENEAAACTSQAFRLALGALRLHGADGAREALQDELERASAVSSAEAGALSEAVQILDAAGLRP